MYSSDRSRYRAVLSRKRRLLVLKQACPLREATDLGVRERDSIDATPPVPVIGVSEPPESTDGLQLASIGVMTSRLEILSGPQATAATAPKRGNGRSASTFQPIQNLLKGTKPLVWVFAGDAVAQGARYTDGQRSFCELFSERIRCGLKREHDVVIDTSAPAETSASLLEDLEWRTLRFRPDVVSVMIGLNDAVAGRGGRLEFGQNLEHIIECIRAEGALLLLQTPPRIDRKRVPSHADVTAYVRILRDVAARLDVPLVDHWAFWKKMVSGGQNCDGWLVGDGLHPTAQGHRALAKLLFRRLGIRDGRTVSEHSD